MEGGVWGIVIIISAFMIQFIAFGINGSIGIYNVEFLEHYDTTAFDVSLISSINLGIFLGTGPIASYLMDRYSHRKVVLVGGFMSSVGILVMPWLPGIPYMYLFYGVINGFGGSLSYLPSHVLSGLYYDKYQGLATGLATGGSGLGITVGPILIAYLIEVYTWKGSLLILSGLSFNVLVFGALLRPPPPRTITVIIEKSNVPGDAVIKNQLKKEENGNTVVPDIDNNLTLSLDIPSLKTKNMNNPENVQRYQKSYLHKLFRNVLTNVDFVIYFVNNIFWNFGLAIVLAFLAELCVQQGISKIDSALVLTLVGLGNFLGCIIGGVLSNIQRLNGIFVFAVLNILSGVCLILITIIPGYTETIIFSFLFGLFTGMVLGYLLAITGEILGVEDFGDGVGVIMIANGIGAFAGPVVAGHLAAGSGDLSNGFIVGGIFCIIGGFIILLIPFRKCFLKNETDLDISKEKIEEFQMGPIKEVSSGPKPTLVVPTITVDDVSDGKDIDDDAPQSSLRKNSFFKQVNLEDEQ
ncbi:hypothetical protein SNE40_019560 [Patella caerulea]|uniref:Major facilitator superfamily (MFS) profile domain-containing protein n=1 Tax=Patella caerulea TaxID=87958 RepID=A0AAN8J947_PATCE